MNLIEALRKTADWIESGTSGYCWLDATRCNCGLLACTVLGIKPNELWQQLHKEKHCGLWGFTIRKCDATGLKLSKVFSALFDAGMTPRDVEDLERLGNIRVLSRMGGKKLFCLNESATLAYMRAWADLLEEEQDARLEAIELRPLNPFVTVPVLPALADR